MQRLIAKADVLLTDIVAGIGKMGMLRPPVPANRSIPGWSMPPPPVSGEDGPWAARPAFDEVIQASSGFASRDGSDDELVFVLSWVVQKTAGPDAAGGRRRRRW